MRPTAVSGRAPDAFPRLPAGEEQDLEHPTLWTVLKLVYGTVAWVLHDPGAMLLGSALVVILLWGQHGRLDLVGVLWPGWHPFQPRGGATVIPRIPWDQEWLSFAGGVLLLVGIPAVLIRRVFRQRLGDYGLALPPPGRRRLALLSSVLLLAVSLPGFLLATHDAGMRATYPLYRGAFGSMPRFLAYELGYFAFFLAVEFIFRGYLLFGVYHLRAGGTPGAGAFPGRYSILVSMLSYTAWHLGKPLPELWGTLLWGVAAGTVVLATDSIWGVLLVHWLLNVLLDFLLWTGALSAGHP